MLDPNLKTYFDKKENKVKLLDQIIEEEVIYQLAKDDGLQRNKEYREKVKEIERQTLINFFIQEKVDKMAEVTKSEVETYFNTNQEEFAAYQVRNLSHILVAEQKEANSILKKLKAGSQFETLAQNHSTDPSKARGGQLGWVRRADLVPEFADVAFKLAKKNDISNVVKTQFGYHIIRMNDTRDLPARDLDSVFDEISQRLLNDKKREMFDALLSNGKEVVSIERTIENL